MRLACDVPVVFVGETGCGKTHLHFFHRLCGYRMEVINVKVRAHAQRGGLCVLKSCCSASVSLGRDLQNAPLPPIGLWTRSTRQTARLTA